MTNTESITIAHALADLDPSLVNAAGDLLSALKGMVASMKHTNMSDFDRARFDVANEAIAKATRG